MNTWKTAAAVLFAPSKSAHLPSDPSSTAAVGHAALAICQSLLLAMTDREIISEQDARDLLSDAASAHRESGTRSQTPEMHAAVAEIIERILATKDVRSTDQNPETYAGA